MNVLIKNKPVIGSLVILLVIILGSIPTQLVTTCLQDKSLQDEDSDVNSLRGVKVEIPKLMKKKPSQLSSIYLESTSEMTNNSLSIPKFFIGEQAGIGGGSYNIYDSFNWSGNAFL
ncbi:MAG: hypothetical protein ACFFDT_02695, partial [Candidatus Hodarchaeota archaeon]